MVNLSARPCQVEATGMFTLKLQKYSGKTQTKNAAIKYSTIWTNMKKITILQEKFLRHNEKN